jgi:hypothetical protein
MFAAKVPPDCLRMSTKLPKTDGLLGAGMGAGMGRLPKFFRVGSRLVLEILPSVAATVIGGYLLAQLHFGDAAEPSAPAQIATTTEEPTVGQDRAAMREVLKERRENPEPPAEVRPVVTAAPAPEPVNPPAAVTAQLPAAMDSISASEPVDHATAPSRPNVAVAPMVLPRARPDSVASVYAPAPPPGLPQAPTIGMDSPLQVAPITLGAPAPAPVGPVVANPAQPPILPPVMAEPPARRGVFSAISSIVGSAASATGNTVNWVIDLPGKAIDAGGRVIGIDPPPPPNRPFS